MAREVGAPEETIKVIAGNMQLGLRRIESR